MGLCPPHDVVKCKSDTRAERSRGLDQLDGLERRLRQVLQEAFYNWS
jgi:hypothetical protein